jgi:hypothetical protein
LTVRRGLSAVLALVGLMMTGCAGGPRAFVADSGLEITSPPALAEVTPPFTVTWTASTADGSYAVFVDRDPIRPGRGMRDVADDQCKRVAGCPDVAYLAQRGVYLTRADHVEVPALLPIGGVEGRSSHPVHTLTIVRLGLDGRRVGDAAWSVEFRE